MNGHCLFKPLDLSIGGTAGGGVDRLIKTSMKGFGRFKGKGRDTGKSKREET